MIKEKKTIGEVDHLNRTNKLNLNPVYQRNEVWSSTQKKGLIDSILNDIDLPKIYLHERDGKYDVVDGKQRITTLKEFMNDSFKVGGKKFSELSDEKKDKIVEFELDLTIYPVTMSINTVQGIFWRYQNGSSLNPAEKRRGLSGNFKNVVKELSDHPIFEKCNFTNKRAGYEDAIAKVLHARINGRISSIAAGSIRATYLNNKNITMDNHNVQEIKEILDYLNDGFDQLGTDPKIQKGNFLTLVEVIYEMFYNYNCKRSISDLCNTYILFESTRKENTDVQPYTDYTNALRGDSITFQRDRKNILYSDMVNNNPNINRKPVPGF